MPKGIVEDHRAATALVALRAAVREYEIGVANLAGRRENTLDLLHLRDRIEDDTAKLEADGLDLRPEWTRIETADGILMRKTPEVMRELGGIGGLAAVREAEHPDDSRWWYFLDLFRAEKQRQSLFRTLRIVGVLVVLILVFNFVMNHYFGLPPEQKAARGHVSMAEQHMYAGEFEEAIVEYENAIAIVPETGDAQVALGILYEMNGDTEASEAAFEAAETIIEDRATYLMTVAKTYELVMNYDLALEYIEEARALAPDSAQVYLIRGGIYEKQGATREAIADYEKSGELAQASGEDALFVLSRTRMGMLLQQAPNAGMPGAGGIGGGF